jgi:hypothetical protein
MNFGVSIPLFFYKVAPVTVLIVMGLFSLHFCGNYAYCLVLLIWEM